VKKNVINCFAKKKSQKEENAHQC